MRLRFVSAFLVSALALFAQSDRGTITGTISDPAGAVVANAAVEARNSDTGAVYPVAASDTGNYTIVQLPSGNYALSVTVPGFKKYVRSGLVVQAAQTIRVDATLEVGNAAESVTVSGEATLLKTESGELSNTVATQTMDTLPLLTVGQNSSGIRNPFNIVAMLPGAFYQPSPSFTGPTVRINGGVAGSETVLIDGMNGTNILGQGANQQNQPGMDSIQEWTVQTSNYSAEFGQAGSAVMNITMKSGTNQFHGSLYEYFQNEFLNAGQPFTNNGNGGLLRPTQRRNDYGLTLGGPIRIPKVYNGRDKTFFFFSWEQFLQNQNFLPAAFSIPTQAYRNGDFSAAITAAGNKNLGTDPLGRPIIANTIYDPTTRQVVNGQTVTNPFPNNQIPVARFDPVALKVQNMLPLPFCVAGPPCNAAGVVNNFQNTEPVSRDTEAPSLKIDHIIGPKDKLSFFWGRTMTYTQSGYGEDGLPQPVSYTFGGGIYSHRERLNYDHTITPTLLLHLGAGYDTDYLGRPSVTPDYDACAGIGLCSQAFQRPATFPSFTGLNDATAGGFGSTTVPAAEPQIGPPGRADNVYSIVDSIASLTWVKGNHTFKFGGNVEFDGSYTITVSNLQGTYGFSSAQTAMPYVVALNTATSTSSASIGPNHIGFPYASFLLGAVDTAEIDPPSRVRFGKQQWGFYAQDSWKVTRKLTLDLGLRYDYSTWYKEQYGRAPNLAPNLADPSAGGHPGATIYQATCGCSFAHNYPWGFGPRFGFAYQAFEKTVFRGGFGVEYTGTGVAQVFGAASGNAAAANRFGPSTDLGMPIMTLGQGVAINGSPLTPAQIAWPNFSPGFYPVGGVYASAGPQYYDQNAGRPARQYQWSFSVQRELARDLVVQAAYIGNRGIWWPTYVGSALTNYNYLSTAILNQYGLNLNNPSDLAILLAPVGSAAAKQFQNHLPFAGFPTTLSVAQSLRPLPQYGSISLVNPPLGDSWYNALQLTATKRFSRGLQFDWAFTWSKSMDTFAGTPDVQNRALAKGISSLDQPLVMRVGLTYTTPKWGPKAVSFLVRDWMFNPFVYYASGTPLSAPTANATGYPSALALGTISNLTFQTGQYQVRTGQPLFLKDLNCHCIDPNTTFVLNPAAWADPGPGQYGGQQYYSDFRGERRPVENLGFGRQFRIRETMSLNLRAEFTNIFNRTYLNNPTISGIGISPQAAPVCKLPSGANGSCTTAGQLIVSGFGSINTSTLAYPPRTGQLVAQFRF
ncbi:MAG: TonB-dependent receptor [Bryobacterales bacterium]|nr:TonB-dependent receptor [Bryobacterales bacterium]